MERGCGEYAPKSPNFVPKSPTDQQSDFHMQQRRHKGSHSSKRRRKGSHSSRWDQEASGVDPSSGHGYLVNYPYNSPQMEMSCSQMEMSSSEHVEATQIQAQSMHGNEGSLTGFNDQELISSSGIDDGALAPALKAPRAP